MIRVGLNGLGRIGRSIFRIFNYFDDIEIVAINDLNPENENIAYLLRFDSYYGRFKYDIVADNGGILFNNRKIPIHHEKVISEVDWLEYGCDAVIEAAGSHYNLNVLPSLVKKGIKKIIVTYSPANDVDQTLVLGANEEKYDVESHHIVSSSICDVISFAPVYRLIDEHFGVEGGFLTTLHPWLAYQNLLDGPSHSWAWPGTLYHHYAVGRASTASIIPKPTTAIEAANRVLPGMENKMRCYSFRIPTPVVGAADITFNLKKHSTREAVTEAINSYIEKQQWPIFYFNEEPLVSVDFTGTDYSAVIDSRWIEIVNGNLLKLTLWYDNEWGYSRRVVDLVRHLLELEPIFISHENNSLS